MIVKPVGKRRLKFGETAELLQTQFGITAGEAQEAAWQAFTSREIFRAWTEAPIREHEQRTFNQKQKEAARELAQRGLIAGHTVARGAARRGAVERARSRLRLLFEVESSAFKDEVIAGHIVLDEGDLLAWYEREKEPAPPPTTKPAPRVSQKQIRTLWTDHIRGLPAGKLPTMDSFRNFAAARGLRGHRPELDAECRRRLNHPARGRRRSKINPPK